MDWLTYLERLIAPALTTATISYLLAKRKREKLEAKKLELEIKKLKREERNSIKRGP